MEKNFSPQETEARLYDLWQQAGTFKPEINPEGEPYTISMPPPNATGTLHLGHAIFLALQDALIRRARMQKKAALWLPGTDHAAIATEMRVIQNLQESGLTNPRQKLGREGLLQEIKEFVENSKKTIRHQTKKMGSSCDWSREGYTMEETLNRIVNEVFVKMYKKGLIYRGDRIVNWDPKLQTTVSDIEVDRVEEPTPFYYLQFGPFEIGTARPETKFGDKYIVMHPDDKRYKKYHHKQRFDCQWINGPITATVIKDERVDPDFGTGAMTITPWHDALDFEIAKTHDLEKTQIIDYEGRLLPIAGDLAGKTIAEARPLLVEKMKKLGLLNKIDENYSHNKAINSRGKGLIEPQIKRQWFIDVRKKNVDWQGHKKSLQEIMKEVVESGQIKIIPERFAKIYHHWVDNLQDWCISRQIWWGHQVPVWYKDIPDLKPQDPPTYPDFSASNWVVEPDYEEKKLCYVGTKPPDKEGWKQDPDTLDTWFSSAFWTWSTLIDKQKAQDQALDFKELLQQSPDFQKFHPTSVLETGYDILPFWVMRMIMMTTANVEQIPFETVYLHGLVRTKDGSKMSKSKPESVVDPIEVIDRFGADALRMALMVGLTPGNDSKIYDEKIINYRNFCTKLWNAARFILFSQPNSFYKNLDLSSLEKKPQNPAQAWIENRLEETISKTDQLFDNFQIGEIGQLLYSFVWDDLCDWYLEIAKATWQQNDPKLINHTFFSLINTFQKTLILLHPLIPFITEEIWQIYNKRFEELNIPLTWPKLLITAPWPQSIDFKMDKPIIQQTGFSLFQELITNIRHLQANLKLDKTTNLKLLIQAPPKYQKTFKELEPYFSAFIKVQEIVWQEDHFTPNGQAQKIVLPHGLLAQVSFEKNINPQQEKKRLEDELSHIESLIIHSSNLLDRDSFVQKAPAQVVEKEKKKLEDAKKRAQIIKKELAEIFDKPK